MRDDADRFRLPPPAVSIPLMAGRASSGPSRWTVLWVIFIARTSMGYQFQSIGSIGPVLVEHLVIDFAMLGTLIGLYKFPGLFLAYPGGLLGRRFGMKSIAVLGLFLMAAGGLVSAWADSYALISSGRVIAGTGAVLFNVLSAALVANWFVNREITLAMAIYVNSWPFGIALGLATQALLLEASSLQTMLLITALLCAGGWFGLLILNAEPRALAPAPISATGGQAQRLDARAFLLVTLGAIVWMLFNAGLILVVGFAPAFLVAEGLSVTESGLLTSVGTWLGIAVIPIAGFAIQRFGHANEAMIALLLGGACIAAAIPWVDSWFIIFALFGLIAWAPAGPIVALPVAHLTAQNRGVGMGLFFSYYYLGMGVFPALAGWIRDTTGSPGAPILFAASLFIGAVLFLGLLRLFEARLARAA
jgi:MFS family permease